MSTLGSIGAGDSKQGKQPGDAAATAGGGGSGVTAMETDAEAKPAESSGGKAADKVLLFQDDLGGGL